MTWQQTYNPLHSAIISMMAAGFPLGSATRERRSAMGVLVLENLQAHFAGRPVCTPVV
jgi:lactate dehydrogenase-like 2-hydroxyacid dehydrogenase